MDPTTHLFTLRIWQEEVESGVYEWRGSIRYGIDGQVLHFAGWDSLDNVSLADVMKQMVGPLADPPDRSSDTLL